MAFLCFDQLQSYSVAEQLYQIYLYHQMPYDYDNAIFFKGITNATK